MCNVPCNVKLKNYSIFSFKFTFIFTFIYINKLTNKRKRNLFHMEGLEYTEEPKSLKN